MMCRAGQLCGTTIFKLKYYFDTQSFLSAICSKCSPFTHISPLTNTAPPWDLKFVVSHIAILNKISTVCNPTRHEEQT